MTRYLTVIASVLLLIIVGSFISIELYIGYHADAAKNDYGHEIYEYYYNDTLNEEEPAMSDTGAYISTASAVSSKTLTEIQEAEKNLTEASTDASNTDGTDGKTAAKTANGSADKTADKTANKATDETANKATGKTTNEAADKATDELIDKTTDQSTDKTTDKAVDKSTKKTAEPDTTLGSYTQIINRDYTLPEDYRPEDLTEPDVRFSFSGSYDKRKLREKAATALEKLFAAAEEDGCILYGVSGFRSYERQAEIYNRNLSTKGSAYTDLYSAKPGTSEHQSGLSIDVSSQSANLQLSESFGTTKEGQWIVKNAWKYGYILRYAEDKADITGYAYEPWHIRYVGKKLAKYLYDNNLCLEEYYECEGGDK